MLGLIAGCLIAEVALRVFGIEPVPLLTKRQLVNLQSQPPVYYHCYPDNPHGEFRPLPEVTHGSWKLQDYTFEHEELDLKELARTPWCVEYRHSSKGIRNREVTPEPPPDVTRVAIVGDSFVFGEGVPETGTLPRQLEELWKPLRIECINAGQVGANTEQEVAILDRVVQNAACSRALLVFIANDVALTQELARRQAYVNDFILIRDRYLEDARSPWSRLRLVSFATSTWMLQQIRNDTLQWYRDSYDPDWNGDNLAALRRQLETLTRRNDCQTVLVLYPLMEGLEGDSPLAEIHATVAQMADSVGLPVIDLAAAFRGQVTSSLWVHAADHHPNSKAHAIAARALDHALREQVPGFLPSEPARPATGSPSSPETAP